LYEQKYPETKRGSGGGRAKSAKTKGAKPQNAEQHPSYAEDAAAAKIGKKPRHRGALFRGATIFPTLPVSPVRLSTRSDLKSYLSSGDRTIEHFHLHGWTRVHRA
jgi:hypothetical protein